MAAEPSLVGFPALPVSVQLGLLLAFVTAFMSVLGFLLKHRGAVAAPPVEMRRPVASTIALFRSPIYAIGCVVATTSWGFHVAALALAPISLVQSVIAGGLVLVTVLADRVFGHDVSRREWIGVGADGGRARLPRGDARGDGRLRARRLRRVDARPLRRSRDARPGCAHAAARRRRARARRRRRPALGRLGRDDQGAERQDRGARRSRSSCTRSRSSSSCSRSSGCSSPRARCSSGPPCR